MITKQRALFYFVGDQAFKSLEEAQKADLKKLIPIELTDVANEDASKDRICDWLLKNSAAIVDCLTTTPKSRLRGRKSHGATRKPRTPKGATPAST